MSCISICLRLDDLKGASRGQVEDHISLVLISIDQALDRTWGVLIPSVGPILEAHVVKAINSCPSVDR